ncbi:MAG: glutaredoxin [Moraxellaceae bacterium]|nr:MAG: glutaredoxin [Moraxellaceae bacterium]
MRFIRLFLGALILFFDWVFTPKSVKRDVIAQQQVDAETAGLSLYQYKACPFCVKVRRSIKRNALNINTYDAKRCGKSRDELVEGSGQLKVPCLKIEESNGEVRWMFESSDIITYLESRVSTIASAA